jgi:hypothetical protein
MGRMFELDPYVCPICGSKTRFVPDEEPDRACINGCITFSVAYDESQIYGATVEFDDEDYNLNFFGDAKYFSLPKEINKLRERIKYWKENDRYLAEILIRKG